MTENKKLRRVRGWAWSMLLLSSVVLALVWNRKSLTDFWINPSSGESLPELGTVENFRLFDQRGREVTLGGLRGQIWIAAFFFTHCEAQCPAIIQTLKRLDVEVKQPPFRIIGFSLDPGRDTPMQLQHFTEHHQLNPKRWSLLTGPVETIQSLLSNSFRVAASVGNTGASHTSHLVLVDPLSQIRGYYDSNSPERLLALKADMMLLSQLANGAE